MPDGVFNKWLNDQCRNLYGFKINSFIHIHCIRKPGIKDKGGHVELSVIQKDNSVEIVIDDNGIGREASKQNKPAAGLTHQSKGVNLTQSRLELDNLLRQRRAQLEMIDKKDEKGLASGTKIIIINEELS